MISPTPSCGEKARRKKAASKTRYTCPDCQMNAWAKPGVHLVCGDCGERMAAEEAETEA
jgi:transcription elongation factor Elf1